MKLSQLNREDREQRHDDYMDHRSSEIASILIRKGREPKRAYEIANRFTEIEYRRLIQWG